jgi:hypothetical protein
MGHLYKITFEGTHKAYIGITTRTAQQRFAQHCETTKNYPISRAIRKYTKEKATVHVLAEADSWEDLCALEIQAIKEHNTKVPHGYNCTDGGDGTLGWNPSQEWRIKRSKYQSGKLHTELTKEKMKKSASNRSEEYRAKMSKSKSVENLSEETRRKLSERQIGRVRGNGENISKALLSRTPEQKAGEKRKLVHLSEETKKKMSEAGKRRIESKTPEERADWGAKISQALKGREFTEEHRAKIALAAKNRMLTQDELDERTAKRRAKNPNLTPEHIAKLDARRARRAAQKLQPSP